jgi:hypothetical protein
MVEDEAGGGFLDAQIFSKCIDGLNTRRLLLVGHLSRDVSDEIGGQIQPLDDVLGCVGFPSNGQLDVAADLAVAFASSAVHFAFRSAFAAVLLAMAVFGVLAVEAPGNENFSSSATSFFEEDLLQHFPLLSTQLFYGAKIGYIPRRFFASAFELSSLAQRAFFPPPKGFGIWLLL